MSASYGLGYGYTDQTIVGSGASMFALDATGEQIRAAIADITKYANGGFLLPGSAGVRINAAARSSVALQRKIDGTYEYAPHNLLLNSENNSLSIEAFLGVSGHSGRSFTIGNDGYWYKSITGAVAGGSITAGFRISCSTTQSVGIRVYQTGSTTGVYTVTVGPTPIDVLRTIQTVTTNNVAIGIDTRVAGGGTGAGGVFTVELVRGNHGSTLSPHIPTTTAAVYAPAVSHDGTAYDVQCEPAATNRVLSCRALINAAWTKSSCTAAYTATGIDGAANSASTLTASGANATCLQSITSTSRARVLSVFLKRRTGTGTVQTTIDGGTTWVTRTLDGTWQRFQTTVTSTNPSVGVRIVTSGDAIDFDVMQEEDGALATSPILTYSATATRAADDPLTPYVPGAAGAVIIDYVPLDSSSHVVASLSDGTSNERHTVTNDGVYTVVDGGATQANPDGGTPTVGVLNKVGFAFAANDFAVALNGATPVTDTSGTLPTVTQLSLAGGPKRVRRIRIQSSKPSGAALQGMTA